MQRPPRIQKKRSVKPGIVTVFIILIVGVTLYNALDVKNVVLRKIYRQDYSEYVNKYAEEYNIDPMWIYAIIKVESNFNNNAQSNSGAKGLMQLMDGTASELAKKVGIDDFESDMLFDPEVNIRLGVKYFCDLLGKYNRNYYLAIAAYNGGTGNVDNWIDKGIITSTGANIENIPYKETNIYVRKTVNSYNRYRELYK